MPFPTMPILSRDPTEGATSSASLSHTQSYTRTLGTGLAVITEKGTRTEERARDGIFVTHTKKTKQKMPSRVFCNSVYRLLICSCLFFFQCKYTSPIIYLFLDASFRVISLPNVVYRYMSINIVI